MEWKIVLFTHYQAFPLPLPKSEMTQQLALKIDMLEQERDELQAELTAANDEIFRQRKYIISCKQIIKHLRPSEQIDDNGDLQPLNERADDFETRDAKEVLETLQEKQKEVGFEQSKCDEQLKRAQRALD